MSPDVLAKAASSFALQADAAIASCGCSTLLLYASLNDEVPTLQYLEHCNREIVLPCVVDDENLILRQYTGHKDLKISGRYHIPEPLGQVFTDYARIDLAFIPGMAFDSRGHRLGRGKGYYDRLLSHPAFRQVRKIGVCFDFQLLQDIPSEDHDSIMDDLIIISTQ